MTKRTRISAAARPDKASTIGADERLVRDLPNCSSRDGANVLKSANSSVYRITHQNRWHEGPSQK